MEVDVSLVAQALTIVLGVLAIYFGSKYRKVKNAMKELAEAINTTYKALEDNKLTEEELKQLIKEWKDFISSLEG